MIEQIALLPASAADSSFGVHPAWPQNSGGGLRKEVADLPSETAKNNSELPGALAQKQRSFVQPLGKFTPRLAKNRQNLRETRPPVWLNWPENVKIRFRARLRKIQPPVCRRRAARIVSPRQPGS